MGFAGQGIAVVAIAADKDAAGLLKVMARHSMFAIFTTVSNRFRALQELQALADEIGLMSESIADPRAGHHRPLERAAATGTWVFATGSLYLVGLLRPELSQIG